MPVFHGTAADKPHHIKLANAQRLLGVLLLLRSARLDALGVGALDVVLGDPALVVFGASGGGRLGARGSSVGFDGLLGLLGGARSAFGLGEQGLDPGLVDKVEGAAKGSSQDEVEEDAVWSAN